MGEMDIKQRLTYIDIARAIEEICIFEDITVSYKPAVISRNKYGTNNAFTFLIKKSKKERSWNVFSENKIPERIKNSGMWNA